MSATSESTEHNDGRQIEIATPASVKPPNFTSMKYPAATQKGYRIGTDNLGKAALFRVAEDGAERLVSGGIWLKGLARDADSLGWCNVVEYVDQDGNHRVWLMPKGLLAGEMTEAIRQLLERGLFVVAGKEAQFDLFYYISHGGKERYTTVDRTGWHGESFVLPDRVIGDGNYLLTNPKPVRPPLGTPESWRDNLASKCVGNSRLLLAVSAALATPLLYVAGIEGGGLHFVGSTSIGKTKALTAASTVFGIEVCSWRTTSNGLEATAAEHSDIGLMLDEIAEIDARHAGEAIYMLGNGIGKVRARRDGSGKPPSTFRLITLTSGEKSLSEHMASGGHKTMAGQEVRLLNIEADVGAGMGLFENIHGAQNPEKFADSLKALSLLHAGHAGPAFVQYIIDNREHCLETVKAISTLFAEAHGLENAIGQVQRVAKRFALLAAAGELATQAGITGWSEHEALKAAGVCFKAWREGWTPSGSREHEKAIEQVRGFLQRHAARFISDEDRTPFDCLGYRQSCEFWIYPSAFSDEVCGGLRHKTVTTALMEAGYLVTENDSKKSCRRRIDGQRPRLYIIRDSILGGEDDEQLVIQDCL